MAFDTEQEIKDKIEVLRKKIAQEIYKELRPYSNVINISFTIDYDFAHKTSWTTTVKTNEEWSKNIVQEQYGKIHNENKEFGEPNTIPEDDSFDAPGSEDYGGRR
jgi:hypothetical protein